MSYSPSYVTGLAGRCIVIAAAVLITLRLILPGGQIAVERCSVDVADLHPDLDGLRIAQVTDLHSTRLGTLERAVFDSVAALAPDLLVSTGDLAVDAAVARQLARRMVAVGAPLGCFAVMGNAEYDGDAESIARGLVEEGVTLLRNDLRKILRGGGALYILGVDDPSTGRSFLEGALLRLNGDQRTPRLLLAHFPTVFPQAVHWGIDVVLAGHTHGGQIVLPGSGRMGSMGSEELDKYIRGDFRTGSTWMHVSRGIGTSRIPVRIGSPPEVTLITLRSVMTTVRRPFPQAPDDHG